MSESKKILNENLRLHEKNSEDYENDKSEIFNEREQQRIREVIKMSKKHLKTGSEEIRALDLGCGTGNILRKLKSRFDHAIGIDLSEDMLSIAMSNIESNGGSNLVRGRISNLPFPNNSFDIVSAYSLLHHLPDFSEPISEIARILKPGGILYIDHEPINREKMLMKIYIKLCDILEGKSIEGLPPYDGEEGRKYCDYHLHHGEDGGISPSRIADICRQKGLDIINTETYLSYRTCELNPFYLIFKPLVSSEWLLTAKKNDNLTSPF